MPADPAVAPPTPASPRSFVRVEYLDFKSVPDHREYRLAVWRPEGPTEFRFRIASAAFGAGRVRLQDGPDVCYQRLLRDVAAGETAIPDVVTIDDAELANYRLAHTRVPKHRAGWTPSAPQKPPFVPRLEARPPSPRLPVAPLATNDAEPALDEGQRVRHAVFGVGVTTSSGGGHTLIRFDENGPRRFVTSMLELEVLSAPHTWETGPRGKNRPRETAPVVR